MVACYSTRLTTDTVTGTTLNWLQVMLFPVFKHRKVYLPWKLAVGPRHIALRVHALSMVFVGLCSSWTSQYAPNSALQCFIQSNVVPVMIARGLYVAHTPLLTGKAFSRTTKNSVRSIMIIFGKRLNGSLVRMERALSLINLVFLPISGTCSIFAVGLILTSGKSGMRQLNSLSISAVLILKPLAL